MEKVVNNDFFSEAVQLYLKLLSIEYGLEIIIQDKMITIIWCKYKPCIYFNLDMNDKLLNYKNDNIYFDYLNKLLHITPITNQDIMVYEVYEIWDHSIKWDDNFKYNYLTNLYYTLHYGTKK